MKRKFALLLATTLVATVLCACGEEDEVQVAETTTQPAVEETEAPKETEATPEVEPEIVPEEPQISELNFDAMTDDEKAELNRFLSKFAETFIYEYDENEAGNGTAMFKFALHHSLINLNSEGIVYSEGEYDIGIKEETLNKILDAYFGQTLSQDSVDGPIWYENGAYWTVNGGEVPYAYFNITTNLQKIGDNTYTVSFSKFYDEENSEAKANPSWYSYSYEQACDKSTFWQTGTATVRQKIYNGKLTYELISYYENR